MKPEDYGRVLAHPMRPQILEHMGTKRKSPKELAEELEQPLGNVSYHVRELLDVGALTAAGTRPRRGAVEHYYKVAPGVGSKLRTLLKVIG